MSKKSFVMYDIWGSMLCMMSDENAGKFIKAMARYAASGRDTQFDDGDMSDAFDSIKTIIDHEKGGTRWRFIEQYH